jgi:hypothetical protein
MGGTGDKIKGKANEMTGKATDDRSKEMKGKAQQGKGEMKDRPATPRPGCATRTESVRRRRARGPGGAVGRDRAGRGPPLRSGPHPATTGCGE